ncbi:AMP-binding protein [Deinococcus deserti]|uniref:Putative o-succinylbenzoate--CoA ligase (OSB-CoA synthetase) (O-succinylbenzoyl-CoA synthetase) n=1 Tax=Deinococcus deserti (strain DSM 17065 / CIP 109153 / LMG 22923 / VCD115) TaxID=546414 RepID=C1CW31_DEIDV|nr:AMP-binding protein [Deinococcus deserti]ACO46398.1 putative o-succinylbenzoate--CoA ligase (OSB-CoA synthetase) (o- succinylbenzoyl-CoA synthetase) [Deinococcus deserti VCD115]
MNTPLTPLEPMLRTFAVYPDRPALIQDTAVICYAELADRTARLLTLLRESGLQPGGHVLLISPNTPDALLAFHAVPLAGGVIVPLNPAFGDEALNFLSVHADPQVALIDAAHLPRVQTTLETLNIPVIVTGDSDLAARLGALRPSPLKVPENLDEDSPISINYTSGTTSDPKGVMLTHRNAFLCLGNLLYHLNLRPHSVLLHALPLAHGNGWGCAWAVTAAGATHVPLPDPRGLREALCVQGITHLYASPALLTSLTDPAAAATLPQPVKLLLAGTSPNPRVLRTLQQQGFEVLHGYGLTETSAVMVVTDEADLGGLPDAPQVLARQGHPMIFGGQLDVVLDSGAAVPHDGQTPGEIIIRSNLVMKGYYKNRSATRRAIKHGWLHTGDLAVVHPDCRVEILDREGDLLKVQGQPVSSAQIEAVLYRHPSVREAVVVAARSSEGDLPVAFVTLHPGAQVLGRELLGFCAPHLPAHALPRRVQLVPELPKTASGKVLKHVLRAQVREKQVVQPAD